MNLGHRPGLVLAVSGAITMGIAASLVYVLAFGDGHGPVPRTDHYYDAVEVCPSAAELEGELRDAAEQYRAHGVPTPSVALGDCERAPDRLVAQVRGDRDLLSSHPAAVTGDYVDRIAHHGDGSAVAYVDLGSRRPCTSAHVLGHLSALGHSTRAISVMHPLCGPSFADVGRRE